MHNPSNSINGYQPAIIPIISRPISTTRILLLSGFATDLKTRDILQVFSEWEDMSGGFRVKWVDDQSAYIVFQDPLVAKKAFLATLSNLPASLAGSIDNPAQPAAKLLPYIGAETETILASIATRPRSRSISQQPLSTSTGTGGSGHTRRLSSSAGQSGHIRRGSQSNNGGASFKNGPPPVGRLDTDATKRFVAGALGNSANGGSGLPTSTEEMSKEQEEAIE